MDLATQKALRSIGLLLIEDGFIFKLFFILTLFICFAIVSYNYRD